MKLRLILVDDEPLARERLRRFLKDEPEVEILAECANGEEAIAAVDRYRPDLLLLDIQMPGMDGFEVLRALDPGRMPQVIFITGHDEHAINAFEAKALDYLLKPTSQERLRAALDRCRERMAGGTRLPERLIELLEEQAAAGTLRRIPIRTGDRVLLVPVTGIDWIEAAGNYAVLHAGKENHILRETMQTLERQLPAASFLRVSRSAIVNLKKIVELKQNKTGDYDAVLGEGTRIPMTRGLKEVEDRLRFT